MAAQRVFIDSMTEDGTRKLCALIKAYWHKAGHPVIEAVPEFRRTEIKGPPRQVVTHWAIKTNLGPTALPGVG